MRFVRTSSSLSLVTCFLLATSSIARAQQTQSKTTEPDDKQDEKLAIYQVHRLGDKILALRSVRAKAFELARLATVLWKEDETHARSLFEKALNLTIPTANDAESSALSTLHRRVIALVARCDAEWAKQLIESAAKREGEDQSWPRSAVVRADSEINRAEPMMKSVLATVARARRNSLRR